MNTSLTSALARELPATAVADLALSCELNGIVWHSDPHVPIGNSEAAEAVSKVTTGKGLIAAAFHSRYRLLVSSADGLDFASVVKTATSLGAGSIIVWVGAKKSSATTPVEGQLILKEAAKIRDLAAAAGLKILFEMRDATWCDTAKTTGDLVGRIEGSGVFWVPLPSVVANGFDEPLKVLGEKVKLAVVHGISPDGAHSALAERPDAAVAQVKALKEHTKAEWLVLDRIPSGDLAQLPAEASALRKALE